MLCKDGHVWETACIQGCVGGCLDIDRVLFGILFFYMVMSGRLPYTGLCERLSVCRHGSVWETAFIHGYEWETACIQHCVWEMPVYTITSGRLHVCIQCSVWETACIQRSAWETACIQGTVWKTACLYTA